MSTMNHTIIVAWQALVVLAYQVGIEFLFLNFHSHRPLASTGNMPGPEDPSFRAAPEPSFYSVLTCPRDVFPNSLIHAGSAF